MPRYFRGAALLIVLMSAIDAPAQSPVGEPITAGLPSRLSLQQAVGAALRLNPGIRAAGLQIDIAAAQRDVAALPARMSVRAEAENFLGTQETSSFKSAETTLQLTRVLELGGKRELRAGLGDARIGLAETESALARLDLAAKVARRFIHLVALQEAVQIGRQAIALADNTLAIVRQRVDVGRSSEAELATAEIDLALARLDLAAFANQRDAARLALAATWGAEEAEDLEAQADLYALPALPPLDRLRERVPGNPELLGAFEERRILEAERRLVESQRQANPELDFGVRHLAAGDETALVFGVSLPLGSRERSGRALAASSAAVEQLAAETERRRLAVLSALAGLYTEAENAYERYVELRDSLLPRSEEAADLYRQGFELSSFSLLEFSQAQQHPLELRREALDAAARYHQTLVAIEQLLGGTYAAGVLQ
jgi:cobalt-zinc-cadmium efflux system outer membrane protein